MIERCWGRGAVLVAGILLAACGGSAQTASPGVTSANAAPPAAEEDHTLVQFGTFNQLAQGGLDGTTKVSEVSRAGDFGLGTFDALAAEMIVLDRVVYAFPDDGVLKVASPQDNTPFAAVTTFHADQKLNVGATSGHAALEALIAGAVPDTTRLLALKVHGTFASIKVRAPHKQSKPYPTFAEATKTQAEFTHENIQGTLVGFRFPTYFGTTNVGGYHFHFVSDDHKKGGHVLDYSTASGTVEIETVQKLVVNKVNP